MERYLAFYPSGDFWVGNQVELWEYLDELQQMIRSGVRFGTPGKRFETDMGETVFVYRERDYTLKICRDGLVLFDHQRLNWDKAYELPFKERDNTWRLAYCHANCISLLFHSALMKAGVGVANVDIRQFREISNQDVSLFAYEGDRPLADFPQPDKSLHARFARRKVVSNFDESCLFELLALRRAPVFQRGVFDILNADLGRLQAHDDEVADTAILAQSYGQFKMGNNSMALVLSWLVIESYISEMWQWTLDNNNRTYPDGRRRINNPRMDALTNGQNYSASVITNALELMGVFSFDIFERIDAVRKVRNKVIHERYGCRIDEAGMAMNVVREIVREKNGVEIHLDLTQYGST